MKSLAAFLLILGLANPARAEDAASPLNSLGLQVFKAVRSGDREGLASLCLLDEDEILAMLKKNTPPEKNTKAGEQFTAALKNLAPLIEQQRKTFDEGWSQIQAELKKGEIEIAKADYYGVDARVLPYEGKSRIARVKVVFRIQDKLYAIQCNDVVSVTGGLKLEDAPRCVEEYAF